MQKAIDWATRRHRDSQMLVYPEVLQDRHPSDAFRYYGDSGIHDSSEPRVWLIPGRKSPRDFIVVADSPRLAFEGEWVKLDDVYDDLQWKLFHSPVANDYPGPIVLDAAKAVADVVVNDADPLSHRFVGLEFGAGMETVLVFVFLQAQAVCDYLNYERPHPAGLTTSVRGGGRYLMANLLVAGLLGGATFGRPIGQCDVADLERMRPDPAAWDIRRIARGDYGTLVDAEGNWI